MTCPVIFLDFDGVICSPRAFVALHNAAPDLIAAADRVPALEAENTRLWEVIREALDDIDDGRSDFARRVLLAGLESCGT